MSSCCVHPTSSAAKEVKNSDQVGILMYGFSNLKSNLALREGHRCPNCDTIGASGNYCNFCQRLIPFSAQAAIVPKATTDLGYFLHNCIVKRQRTPVAAMSKRYETKVQNGLLIMTRRRTSRSELASEPDRKKVRTNNSAKVTNRDKMISRFCDFTSRAVHRPAAIRQRDGANYGNNKKSIVRDPNTNAVVKESASKKADVIDVEVKDNRINLPVSKASRNRSEPVKTAVVAPYFGEKPATKIFVSSEPISRNSSDSTSQINQILGPRPQYRQAIAVAEPVAQVHSQSDAVIQSPTQTQAARPTVLLSNSSQQQSQLPLQTQVQQSPQIANQSRQQMIQLVVTSQTQVLEHSTSSTQSIQAPSAAAAANNDVTINNSVSHSPGTPIQRAVVSSRLPRPLQQHIQIRRPIRHPNRRQAIQIAKPGTGTTVVANQAFVNLPPGRVVYVQQPVSESNNSSVSNVSTIIRNTPINQVTGQSTVRSTTVTINNVNAPSSTTPTSTVSQISPSLPDSPGPENDELVIIGLSGVSRTPVVTRTVTTTSENSNSTRSSSQQGQTSKYIEKFVYAPNGNDGITLTNEDVLLLNAECYLNDVLIDFYLKYVFHAQLSQQQQRMTYIFNSFFYTRLTHKMPTHGDFSQGHASVAKWTRRVDLFTKDFVLIPINENSHWFLAIICFPWLVGTINYAGLLGGNRDVRTTGSAALDLSILNDAQRSHYRELRSGGIEPMPCILMFDSLIGQSRSPNVKILRDYLQCEWNLKSASEQGNRFFNKDTIRGFSPKVPQQPNGYDCGVFVLNYAELFYRRPVRSFTKGYFQNEMDDWFDFTEVRHKRLDIRNLIIDLWRGCQTEVNSASQ